MANVSDTIIAFIVEETRRDGYGEGHPNEFAVNVGIVTRGFNGEVPCYFNPNDNAATIDATIVSQVITEAVLRTGRTFNTSSVRLAGGFA